MTKMKISGLFVARPVAMLEAPALWALSRTALLILNRLETEYSKRKRATNGRLSVPYRDLERCGLHVNAIAPALRELQALGFIQIAQGSAGNAAHRRPNLYRLTYLADAEGSDPTHDWRAIETLEQAEAIAFATRSRQHNKSQGKKKRSNSRPRKPRAGASSESEGENGGFPPSESEGARGKSPPSESEGTLKSSSHSAPNGEDPAPAGRARRPDPDLTTAHFADAARRAAAGRTH
jgi:hypothetical protein